MSEQIEGKVVVITGASSGLGEAAARLLAGEGAAVVLGARRADRLQALAGELAGRGGRALAVETDVTDRGQVSRLVDAAVTTYGRVDVMLNNASQPGIDLHVWEQTLENWNRCIAAALPHMQRQRSGHIINVSSVAGHKVRAGAAVYAATKHAVRALSEGLRQEVKRYNIRTTVISPGAVDSELADSATEPDVAATLRTMYEEIGIPAVSFARMVAFAIGQPEDVDINEILFRPTSQEL